MKILLDECLPVRLKKYLSDFDVATVTEMGWTGFKNGKLLKLASEEGFDVLFTVDKNLRHQQKISEFDITIVVFDILMNRLQDILPLLPKAVQMLPEMKKNTVYII
jgi:hypothetical protein